MKKIISAVILAFASLLTTASGQAVSIPDPGLNAAIRSALQIPTAPLTEQDLLQLRNLDASRRNVKSAVGLDAARNLVSLNLQINQLTNFSVPTTLTNLLVLDLSINPLNSFAVPSVLPKLASLNVESCNLTNLTIPATLTALTNLDAEGNRLSTLNLSSNLTGLVSLNLGFNLFTNFSLPARLTNLSTFYFAGNPLTNATFPPGLSGMTELNLSQNLLTNFTLPAGMTHLEELNLGFNQLTNVNLPSDLASLSDLELSFNRFTSVRLPANLTNLHFLRLRANLLTNYSVPPGLTALIYLDVSEGPLTSITFNGDLGNLRTLRLSNNRLRTLTVPSGLTNLQSLYLPGNLLTNLALPSDLSRLDSLNLSGNALTSLTLPRGLTHLTGLFMQFNQLTSLTLPPDMTNLQALSLQFNQLTNLNLPPDLSALTTLVLANNQITTLILPAGLTSLTNLDLSSNPLTRLSLSQAEAANLAQTVTALRAQGVTIVISANSPPPIQETYVTSQNLGTLHNDFTGFAGMQIVVGSNPITVTALGRMMAPANVGVHTVKLVRASDGTDVPGGSVAVAMSGGTSGHFQYANLASPVVLSAGETYYLVSQETLSGDSWYYDDTIIQTTSVASETAAAWGFGPGQWHLNGGAGQAYGPVDFKYTPAAPPSQNGYVTSQNLGTIHNDFTGFAGMQIVVGSNPITVTALGRMMAPANVGVHTVKLVRASDGTDVPGGWVSVAMTGGTVGQFQYANLVSPVVLSVGATYYLVSQETSGGDAWYYDDTIIQTTSVANETAATWGFGPGQWHLNGGAGQAYGPVNFEYSTGGN